MAWRTRMFSRRPQTPSGPTAALGGLFLGFRNPPSLYQQRLFLTAKWFFWLISGLLSAHSRLLLPHGFCFLPSFCGFFCFLLLYSLHLTTKLSNQENQNQNHKPLQSELHWLLSSTITHRLFQTSLFSWLILIVLTDLSVVGWQHYLFIRLGFPHVLSCFTPSPQTHIECLWYAKYYAKYWG